MNLIGYSLTWSESHELPVRELTRRNSLKSSTVSKTVNYPRVTNNLFVHLIRTTGVNEISDVSINVKFRVSKS